MPSELCKAVAQDIKGVTAIEFAFVAPIFALLFFAILEAGLISLTQALLQNAVNDASRSIKVGQVQSTGISQDQFRDAVCEGGFGLIACADLIIDVETHKDFTSAQYEPPTNSQGELSQGLSNFVPGKSGDIVLVRALYPWQVITPGITPFLSNMSGGKRLLVATAAFRNE
jgi:Flp pilus assembly protein TadG